MNFKNNKGSITIFVLVALLFMSAFLMISYANNVNKSKIVKEQFNIIDSVYYKDNDSQSYNDVYSLFRKRNRKLLTSTIRNSKVLELTSTFEENVKNYTIYGNYEGLGNKVTNSSDENYGKYRIPIKVSGLNSYKEYNYAFPEESILVSIAGQTANYMAVGGQNKTNLEADKQYIIKFDYEVLENTDINYYVGNAVGKTPNSISYSAFTETYKTIYQAGSENTKGTIEWVVTTRNDRDFEVYAYLTFGIACGNRAYQKVDQNTENTGSIKITNVRLYEYQEGNDYNANGQYVEPKTYNIYLDEPLSEVDYIDFVAGKVIRADGTEENINLPEISTLEDYTKIEILTETAPSKVVVEYYGYSELEEENRKIITEAVNNNYKIELNGSLNEEIYNCRIFGTAQGIGKKVENLFDPELNFTATNNRGITIEYLQDEQCYLINGTASGTAEHSIRFINIPITKGEAFSLSADYISGSVTRPNGTEYAVGYFGKNDEVNLKTNWQTVRLDEIDQKAEACVCDCNYITAFWFYIAGGVSFDNYKVRILLERGEVAEKYENMDKYKIPVKVGRKNLACKQTIIENGFIEQEDGSFYTKLSSTPYKKILYENKDRVPGSLTISFYIKYVLHNNYVGCSPVIIYTDGTKKSLSDLKEIAAKPTEYVKAIYTTDANKTVDYIYWGYYTGGAQTFFKDMQIEYGNTATDYEPYAQKYYIYLDAPLAQGDYIDYASGQVIRSDGSRENITLPTISARQDYTTIEVLTDIVPSKIEVEYYGYTD